MMPPLLISLLPCALGLGKTASWVSPWQNQLMRVGSQLSPNQRRGFLASSPIAPNPPKGTQEMQTRRGKKPHILWRGLEPKLDPRYAVIIAVTVAYTKLVFPLQNSPPAREVLSFSPFHRCRIRLRLPRWHGGKESICQCRRRKRPRFNPWAGKIPWRRKW